MTSNAAVVVSVNVGEPRTVVWRGRSVTSAIWKHPVDGPVPVDGVNLNGDDQADRRVHGGPDKAVYSYSTEHYAWWSSQVGALSPGTFGENLTISGIDFDAARIGDRWRIGSALLEVAQPRQPCFKLGIRMDDDTFPDRFAAAQRPGIYLRIVEGGTVAAGDTIEVVPTELPAISILSLVEDNDDVAFLRQVAADSRVPDGWRRAAQRALRH